MMAEEREAEGESLADDAIWSVGDQYDYLAPDGSEIRLLVSGDKAGLVHCVLSAGRSSSPLRHRTVEELWYVIDGQGELWRQRDGKERTDRLQPGDSIRIVVGTSFQLRAAVGRDLKLLIATIPRWSGPYESVQSAGKW